MSNKDKQNQKEKVRGTYFRDYLKDRRAIFILYLITVLLFLMIGSLYHLDNLPKLWYAFGLSCFLWGCYGVMDFRRYVLKRKKIYLADCHLEQAVELLVAGSLQDVTYQEKAGDGSSEAPYMTQLEYAYEELISHLCAERSRLESEMEQRRTDRNDYYLMWAHQIKTPIAAIKLLLNDREDSFLLSEELFKVEQYVEMVLHYLKLESIASDLLLKEYNLYQMVKQTVKKYSVLFINSGLSLELEDFKEITVLTDEKWLCFVLEQLLSNSIKYTKKGKISIYMQPDAVKTLVIEDTGIGIRSEDLPRIFERGFTGYNGRMDKKSTGIGLYLCRQVISQLAHGIRVISVEGNGTKVFLELDRAESDTV